MSSHSKLDRVSSIDGLRGLAALAVLLYHARGSWWIGASETFRQYGWSFNANAWLGYATVPLSLGSLGVTLFFVLSGYCIHRRGALEIAADPSKSIDLKRFFVRRFWRIYPTYLAALLLTAVIDWWIYHRTGINPADQDNSLHAFIVSLFTLQGYFARFYGSNGVFWTLAMEVHLYLAYPLLYFVSKKCGPKAVLLLTLTAGILYFVSDYFWGIEKRLPFRFIEGPVFLPFWFTWAAGFHFAEIEAKRVKDFKESTWGVLMITGLIVGLFLTAKGLTTHANMPWALFFVGMLRWSLKPVGAKAWALKGGQMLALLGAFSYSLYAVHAPVLRLLHFIIDPVGQAKFQTIWPAMGASVVAILLGWVFFRMVEYWSVIPHSPKKPQ